MFYVFLCSIKVKYSCCRISSYPTSSIPIDISFFSFLPHIPTHIPLKGILQICQINTLHIYLFALISFSSILIVLLELIIALERFNLLGCAYPPFSRFNIICLNFLFVFITAFINTSVNRLVTYIHILFVHTFYKDPILFSKILQHHCNYSEGDTCHTSSSEMSFFF